MATIKGAVNEKVFTLSRWLGLNQADDGDTVLKMGEAANMRNFRITRTGHLQKRPGTLTQVNLNKHYPIKGLWHGWVNREEVVIGACDGKLYSFLSPAGEWQSVELGSVNTAGDVHLFGFSEKLYILTLNEYKEWDGTNLSDVIGYRPLVRISAPPEGGGDDLENINRLNGQRRMWFSPDGEGAVFTLPEKSLSSIDYVKNTATGAAITDWTGSTTDGTVTFEEAPAEGVNSIEIGWTVTVSYRQQVTNMRFSEFYNASQDTRVFLYGDGSNRCIYSGIDYDGIPRADYFPDLYEARVGDANTPITAMIRHYSTLVCFKTNSTYSISYGDITLSDGTLTAGFYVTPVNRSIGNAADGQVQLVLNNPRTLYGYDLYEWKNSSYYSSNLTSDERQAQVISNRINSALSDFNIPECVCYDDNLEQEYYICYNGQALVNNYISDAWYVYTDMDIQCMTRAGEHLVFGTSDGKIKELAYSYTSDDGEAIDCYWESGAMSFGQDFMRKYAAMLWVGVAPEIKTRLTVTAKTDRTSELAEKGIEEEITLFDDIDFADFEFGFNTTARMKRMKIKAKKFVFYKLCFKCRNDDAHATVLGTDIKVRFTGYAK